MRISRSTVARISPPPDSLAGWCHGLGDHRCGRPTMEPARGSGSDPNGNMPRAAAALVAAEWQATRPAASARSKYPIQLRALLLVTEQLSLSRASIPPPTAPRSMLRSHAGADVSASHPRSTPTAAGPFQDASRKWMLSGTTSSPAPGAVATVGAVLRVAWQARRVPGTERGRPILVVLGSEVGERWSQGALQLVRDLVRSAKAGVERGRAMCPVFPPHQTVQLGKKKELVQLAAKHEVLLHQLPFLQDLQVSWLLLSRCSPPSAQYLLRDAPGFGARCHRHLAAHRDASVQRPLPIFYSSAARRARRPFLMGAKVDTLRVIAAQDGVLYDSHPTPPQAMHTDGVRRPVRRSFETVEVADKGPQRLVVLAAEVGGRWGEECQRFVRQLLRLRVQRAPAALRAAAAQGWARRWWGLLSVAVQRAVASTALGVWTMPALPSSPDGVPLADVFELADFVRPSRLPYEMGYVFPGGSILAWRQGGDVVVFWEIRIVRGGVMSGCLVVRNGEVDETLDVLVGVLQAGQAKEANMLAAELRHHLLSLQRNDQLWKGKVSDAKKSADSWRQELQDTRCKLDEVYQDLKDAAAERAHTEVELKSVSQKVVDIKDEEAHLQTQLQNLRAEQQRLETQRLLEEEQNRKREEEMCQQAAAEEQRRQEAALQEAERQRLAEEQRRQEAALQEAERQRLAEEQRRQEAAFQEAERQRLAEEQRRQEAALQEAERQRLAEEQRRQEAALQEAEKQRLVEEQRRQEAALQEAERQRLAEEQRRQEAALQEAERQRLAEEQRRQEAALQEAEKQRLVEEQRRQEAALQEAERQRLAEEQRRQEAALQEAERQRLAEEQRRQEAALQEAEKQRLVEEQRRQEAALQEAEKQRLVEEQRRQEAALQEAERQRLAEEQRRQEAALQETERQRLAELQHCETAAAEEEGQNLRKEEAVELPRVALHGFDRSNFSKNEVGFEKPLEHMEAVSPQCSDVTELDAATEPLHSDESQSQTEEPAREPEIGPEKQPPQPQQPQPQQPSLLTSCSSPQAFSVNARERQCGERFLELGKRLGRANEDVQDKQPLGEAPAACAARAACAAGSASTSLRAAEAALRAAAAQRMASAQQLIGGAASAQSLFAPVPHPHHREAYATAAPVSVTKGTVIARSLSPVRAASPTRLARAIPHRGVLSGPWFESQKASQGISLEAAQSTGIAPGALRHPFQAAATGGPTVQKEYTQPARGLSPVPVRFRSMVVPAAGSASCHGQANVAGDRSHLRQPATPRTDTREVAAPGLAPFPAADHMMPVVVRPACAGPTRSQQQMLNHLNHTGSLHAPVSQQVELVRQMPGSPVYATRQLQLPLAGSFVAPGYTGGSGYLAQAARPCPDLPAPARPTQEASQRARSPIQHIRWPLQAPQRATSPLRPARWLHTADPSWSCDPDSGHAVTGERPEETRYVGVARLADHVRRFPQTVQTISGGTVRNVTMEPVDVPKKSSTKTAL
ncbi:unnamed protein product [Symbiodinium natans]|uniref:Uncharacterized protein n=1 Tax=Symbiodinium natans TaxID=878477 RepID=A0A812SUW3_9DINO|nr:unnamed protein product [Symbiodinium natans]